LLQFFEPILLSAAAPAQSGFQPRSTIFELVDPYLYPFLSIFSDQWY
jgi:hypothetical protein